MAYILQDTSLFAHSYGIWLTGNGCGDLSYDMLIFFPFHVIDIFHFHFSFDGQIWFHIFDAFFQLVTGVKRFVFLRQQNVVIGETQIMCKELNEAYNNLRLHTRFHMLPIPNTLGGLNIL